MKYWRRERFTHRLKFWRSLTDESEKTNSLWCLAIVCLYALATCLLHSKNIVLGRIWAEEGLPVVRAYSDAFRALSVWDILALSGTGYLQLGNNITILIMQMLVPLEYAPTLLHAYALFFQTLPLILFYAYRRAFPIRPLDLLVMAILMLFVVQQQDITLSTTGLQFILSISVAVVLILPAPVDFRLLMTSLLLFVAGTTGVPSLCMLPLFALRCLVERSKGRFIQLGVLSLAAYIQAGYLMQSGVSYRPMNLTVTGFLASLLAKIVIVPYFGDHPVLPSLRTEVLSRALSPFSAVLVFAGLPLFLLLLSYLVLKTRRSTAILLLAAALLLSGISIYGSLEGFDLISFYPGNRYFYAPLILISVAILFAIRQSRFRPQHAMGAFLLVVFVFIGVSTMKKSPNYGHSRQTSWFDEIRAWKQNPSHAIAITPELWEIDLNRSFVALFSGDAEPVHSPTLGSLVQISQSFRARKANMDEVAIRVEGVSSKQARIAWRLYEAGPDRTLRASGEAQVFEGHPRQLVRCTFPRIGDSEGRDFVFEMEIAPQEGLKDFKLPLYGKRDPNAAETYPTALLGGQGLPKDLFAYIELGHLGSDGFVGLRR